MLVVLVFLQEVDNIISIIVPDSKGITMTNHNLQHMAYVSCPLSNIPPDELVALRTYYEQIGQVLEDAGYIAYLPHVFGDPLLIPDLSAQQIDTIDRIAVSQSSLMVVYMGRQSHGAGQEIEMARTQHMPIIMMARTGDYISRLPRGSSMLFDEIITDTWEESLDQLAATLVALKTSQPEWLPEILKL